MIRSNMLVKMETCRICKDMFPKSIKKNRKGSLPVGVRTSKAVTCSRECSRAYASILNRRGAALMKLKGKVKA